MASSPPHRQSPPSAPPPPPHQSPPSAPPPQQSPPSAPLPPQSPASAPPQQSPASAPPQSPPALAEIAFFDVETTIPSRNTPYSLLEFGAILVCPRRLVEVGSYSTLIRPADLTAISSASVRCNGITPVAVASAPSFRDVADNVFTILDGRVWAGHNIARFDCTRIREAFAEIGRAAPEPRGLIDTLPLLTQRFGRRAGDMKMASLASFFGLGKQMHRSLDDVRMNLEVLKYCATVLFLESSFTDMYSANSWFSENGARSQVNGKSSPEGNKRNFTPPSDLCSKRKLWTMECKTILEVNHVAESSMSVQTVLEKEDPSDLISHIAQINIDPLQTASTGEQSSAQSPEIFTSFANSEGSSGHAGFLDPLEVSPQCISASQASIYQYGCRILLLHKDAPLQLYSMGLRVHFGLSTKFVDHAGRPKLSIVVAMPDNLCQILDSCEHLARRSSLESGSSSEWRPVIKRNGYTDSSLARLNIPTAANDDVGIYSTEIYQKEQSGNLQRIVFSRLNPSELESLFVPGAVIDAFFSVDFYDYQNSAGLRLVAKRLVAHPR